MSVFDSLLARRPTVAPTAVESNGYHERVPIRVGEFALVENEEDQIVFHTTSSEFCDGGTTLRVSISADDGWSTEARQGSYRWTITPNVEFTHDRLERRRACWHAAQFMLGRDLSHSEQFTLTHQAHNDDADVFKDDAFFENGDPVTTDPFGECLEE